MWRQRAETRFRLSAKRTSPFQSAGVSVQSTTGSRGVRISGSNGSNAGYTMFRDSVKVTGYPLHSPVSPSLPPPPRASPSVVTFQLASTTYWDLTEYEGSLVMSTLRSTRSSHSQVSNTVFVRATWPNPVRISLLCTKCNYAREVYQITKNVSFSSNWKHKLKVFAKSHWPETKTAVCPKRRTFPIISITF
jgi:hypothetical protein